MFTDMHVGLALIPVSRDDNSDFEAIAAVDPDAVVMYPEDYELLEKCLKDVGAFETVTRQ